MEQRPEPSNGFVVLSLIYALFMTGLTFESSWPTDGFSVGGVALIVGVCLVPWVAVVLLVCRAQRWAAGSHVVSGLVWLAIAFLGLAPPILVIGMAVVCFGAWGLVTTPEDTR